MNRLKQILLIIGMVLLPVLVLAAGTLKPNWSSMTLVGGGPVLSGTTHVGTVSSSLFYVTKLSVVMQEDNESPTGSAGCSIYASSGCSGIPIAVATWNATSFKDHSQKGGSGVTKVFYFENVDVLSIGVGKDTAADTWGVSVYQTQMYGDYT